MLEPELFPFANRKKIILDLFQAYFDARKNKRNTINALAFEKHLETNLFALSDEIMNRNYKPRGCICFIINKLKKYDYMKDEALVDNRYSKEKQAQAIREKMPASTSDAPLFPLIAQQRYNEYIKEVFRACGTFSG